MELSLVVCPSCGAPLPPHAVKTVVVCKHCGASVAKGIHVAKAERFAKALRTALREAPTSDLEIEVAGRRYALEGRIARGESSDVFIGREARRSSTRVIVKVLRADSDRDLLEREHDILTKLVTSEKPGAPYLSLFVPYPVHVGEAKMAKAPVGFATVHRAPSGFVHTLADVQAAHGASLDPRHAVWIFRRLLEVLAFVHDAGIVHGALFPEHVLLHTQGHGVMLVGFTCAAHAGKPAIAWREDRARFYPPNVRRGDRLLPGTDLVMAARGVAWLLGADEDHMVPEKVPAPFGETVTRFARADPEKVQPALEVFDEITNAAAAAFGKPQFVRLETP